MGIHMMAMALRKVIEKGVTQKFEYFDSTPDNFGYDRTGDNWAAAVFYNTEGHFISSVKLHLYRGGSPDTVTVSIRAVSGGDPTGSDLVVGTTNGNTLSTSNAGEWREIKFSTPRQLAPNTWYAIVIRCSGTGSVYVKGKYTAIVGTGNARKSSDGGVTWSDYRVANKWITNFWYEDWGYKPV